MRVTLYAHIEKDDAYCSGQEAGLSNVALKEFVYAGYEVELEYEVNPENGKSVLVKVDGKEFKESA